MAASLWPLGRRVHVGPRVEQKGLHWSDYIVKMAMCIADNMYQGLLRRIKLQATATMASLSKLLTAVVDGLHATPMLRRRIRTKLQAAQS